MLVPKKFFYYKFIDYTATFFEKFKIEPNEMKI